MRNSDPFAKTPEIDTEDVDLRLDNAGTSINEDLGKKPPSKNILKSISKYGIPALFIVIVIYLFSPDPKRGTQLKESAPIEIDAAKQAVDSNLLLNTLKEDAVKAEKNKVNSDNPNISTNSNVGAGGQPRVQPIINGGVYSPSGPVPELVKDSNGNVIKSSGIFAGGSSNGTDSDRLQKQLEREETIRGSDTKVADVTLLTDSKNSLTEIPSSLQLLQSEIEAKKKAATDDLAGLKDLAISSQSKSASGLKVQSADAEFLKQQVDNGSQSNFYQQQQKVGPVVVEQNSVIRAVLISAINSDLMGDISARVTSDVYDSSLSFLVIPKGSKLIGSYNSVVSVGQRKLFVAINRLILPNGTWISTAGAVGTDPLGQSGLTADVNNHFFKIFSSSLIIGGASLLLPNNQNTVSTTSNGAGSVTTGSVAALALNDTLQTLIQRNKNIAPTLTVDAGTPFSFFVPKDLVMNPYRK